MIVCFQNSKFQILIISELRISSFPGSYAVVETGGDDRDPLLQFSYNSHGETLTKLKVKQTYAHQENYSRAVYA